ncbi:MAG: Molybdenum-pterin-binding protein MopA [Pelotomaculum sp. PtaB.Bin104]|nr:MAG: Molybdenum-pterin-binding protein MopA [Pelotomaculum sp. PtaB.Bin104]
MHQQSLQVKYKLWLEKDGIVIGAGLVKLLAKVAWFGSISQAARDMDMSYRNAWGKIKTAEKHCGVKLVLTQVGGELGGGTKLTPEAVELIARFYRLEQKVDEFVQNSFKEMFSGLDKPLK